MRDTIYRHTDFLALVLSSLQTLEPGAKPYGPGTLVTSQLWTLSMCYSPSYRMRVGEQEEEEEEEKKEGTVN